ncbi:MAG: AglZ/HisF2 family acetamidino modification protein [Chitinophagales bacterium]|nr:AglZ/HisF2 family acetamidino modification protein [Chitinophagales bacterium]
MALKRIMPCLLYNGKSLVKTVNFKNPAYIGDPVNAIKIYNEKEVDELVLLDINATRENRRIAYHTIRTFASECFMPFSYGGGVKTMEDFKQLFQVGVEKVIVNTLLFTDPQLVTKAAKTFGAQSIIASVDVKTNFWGKQKTFSYSGQKTQEDVLSFCRYLENEVGVGELLLTSVDKEGTWEGYDFTLVKEVAAHVSIPIIACGGAGQKEHLQKALYEDNAQAAALGSMAVYQKKGMGVLINFPSREQIINE